MNIKATDFLKYDIKPFLYGLLFSRIMSDSNSDNPDRFYVYTAFKTSKVILKSDFSLKEYSKILVEQYNSFSGYNNWVIHSSTENKLELRFYIDNNLNINSSQFYNLIYRKMLSELWIHNDMLTNEKKEFIRGYMEPRGSIDISANLISQDYFYNNSFELKRVLILTDMMNLPISYANLNFRNMQPDYVTGKNKRNTQFRINLYYYAKNIGFINEYKAKIFEKAYKIDSKYIENGVTYFNCEVPLKKNNVEFIKYLNFFTNNIYNKKLTAKKVEILRKEYGLDEHSSNKSRNRTIVNIFDDISEDKCSLCDTTETFIKKSNGRNSFQIHHMIPFHHGVEYDNIANLVKLCPTCHASFKKGASPKKIQIQNIISILHKEEFVFQYVSSALGISDINELAEYIWSILG